MEHRRGSGRGSKRHSKPRDGFWDCSVCTYRNSPEAYKCEMCDVRKGTSTRKPRINPQLAQRVAQQFAPPPVKKERLVGDRKKEKIRQASVCLENGSSTLSEFDRSKASQMSVTCNNVTVVITDYPHHPSADNRSSSDGHVSDTSDTNSSLNTPDTRSSSPSANSFTPTRELQSV